MMPSMQPPPGRGPQPGPRNQGSENRGGFGVPQQRDSNADSGPTPRRSPGARGAEALRQAQQFDVFRRDPVVPQQASPADGNDFDEAADRTALPRDDRDPRDLRDLRDPRDPRGQVDISVFDAPEAPERPGFDLRAPLRGPASYDQPTDIIPAVLDDPGHDSFGQHPGSPNNPNGQNADFPADEAPGGFGTPQGFPPGPQGFAAPQVEEQAFGEQGFPPGPQGFAGPQGYGAPQGDEQAFGEQGFAPGPQGYGAPQGDEQAFGEQGFPPAPQGFGLPQGEEQAFGEQGFPPVNNAGFGTPQGFPSAGAPAFGAEGEDAFGGHGFGAEGAEAGFGAPQGFPPAGGTQGFPPVGGFGADEAVFDGPQGFGAESGHPPFPPGQPVFDARQGFPPAPSFGEAEEPGTEPSFGSRPQGFPPAADEPVFPPAQDAHSAGIDPQATFGGPQAFAPQAGNDPSFGARPGGEPSFGASPVDEPVFGAAAEAAASAQSAPPTPVFGAPEGGMPSFGDRPLTPNTGPDYGLGAEAQAEPPLGAHLDPPRFEPAPPVFDDPAEGVEFGGAGEEPGPVFATPTVAIAPVEDAALDEDADVDAEPEMLVPWAATAGPESAEAEAAEFEGQVQGPVPVPAPVQAVDDDLYDTDGEPYDDVPRVPPYDDAELAAVHRVIRERRDVRSTFLADPIPDEVLTRVLEAAHTAPSVGFSQPWDFLVLRSRETRQAVHDLAARQRDAYSASLPKARQKAFKDLKIEAILDTPVNIVVTCDPTRGGRHTLGRHSQPQMAPYSAALAVENLWLAARAEGLGVGWVSFFDERELTRTLDLPDHLSVVAYLCVGFVHEFPGEPELSGAGWAKRRPLAWAVHDEQYGRRALPGSSPVSLLEETLAAIGPLDEAARDAAVARQEVMTKPAGSLGVLEDVSIQLTGLAGVFPPPIPEPAAVAIFAADHGVHAQGVTPWPQEVTAQMVLNFLSGGAVVNAFAHQIGAEVCVVDVGVNADLPQQTGLVPRKIRYGTADLAEGPAMTREEALTALEVGVETARDLVAAGNKVLLTGDMGIANTTASAALIAAFTGASPTQVTGYGTGIDEQTYAHKVDVVRRALDLHRPDPADPLGVLAAVGGLEHAALAGFILGAASLRIPVILDGVIAGAAALVAQALAPDATAAMVAGHRSAESGHQLALEALGVVPLIDLELRLGEGSGAVLALPLVQAAVRALRDVATFESAGVAERADEDDENAA
ncbi:nicotinate-nucleotide--dimethylbenzimidazole phosphoribosyltransferase [Catenulispora sp. GAS73]